MKIGNRYLAIQPERSFEGLEGETVTFPKIALKVEILPKPEQVIVDDGISQTTEVLPEHLKSDSWLAVRNLDTGRCHWLCTDAYEIYELEAYRNNVSTGEFRAMREEEIGACDKNSPSSLALGTPLGLCDSNGVEFKNGSIVRCATSNIDIHGTWVEYEVILKGVIPLLSYLKSEKGEVLSKGYTACCLSDFYTTESLVFASDPMSLRPSEGLYVQ